MAKHRTKIDLLIILLSWFVGLLIVNPLGNFPLNDDWSYGLTVQHFLRFAEFRPTENVAMPLLTNVLWGSLFCVLKGFSFTALRFSTLCMALIGLVATYFLARDLCQSRWFAIILALVLGFNPIFFALSNTFMTDVPFLTIITIATIFFVRSLRKNSDLDLVIGIALTVAATLSRQLAISVPLAYGIARVLKYGLERRNIVRAIISPAVCILVLLIFQHWLSASGRLPADYFVKSNGLIEALHDPRRLLFSFSKNSFVALLYLGLFLFPVSSLIISSIWHAHRKQFRVVFFAVISTLSLCTLVGVLHGFSPACTSSGSYRNAHLMPMSGNVLLKSGIGPLMLPDNWMGVLYVPVLPQIPRIFWLAITALSVLGAGFMITILYVGVGNLVPRLKCVGDLSDDENIGAFLLLSAAIYLIPIVVSSYIDRYLVPVIPFLAIGITCLLRKPPEMRLFGAQIVNCCAIAILVACSFFAVAATKDYLAWNRTRWEALDTLVNEDRVDVREIDGGLEFNGLYMYDPHYHYDPRKSWWWVQGNKYLICFGPKPGYEVIREYGYRNWLPPYSGKILVLKKIL